MRNAIYEFDQKGDSDSKIWKIFSNEKPAEFSNIWVRMVGYGKVGTPCLYKNIKSIYYNMSVLNELEWRYETEEECNFRVMGIQNTYLSSFASEYNPWVMFNKELPKDHTRNIYIDNIGAEPRLWSLTGPNSLDVSKFRNGAWRYETIREYQARIKPNQKEDAYDSNFMKEVEETIPKNSDTCKFSVIKFEKALNNVLAVIQELKEIQGSDWYKGFEKDVHQYLIETVPEIKEKEEQTEWKFLAEEKPNNGELIWVKRREEKNMYHVVYDSSDYKSLFLIGGLRDLMWKY